MLSAKSASPDDSSGFVVLSDVVPDIIQEIRYYSTYKKAVDHFVNWAEDIGDKHMKPYFYPKVDKTKLFDEGYIDAKSGHSRGSTIDLTLFDMKTGKEVDMGGTFDYFGELSHVYK